MNERDEQLAMQAIAYGIAAELIEKRAASVKRASAPSGFTDEDYAGLLKVAADYGNLPELSVGKALGLGDGLGSAAVDTGLYFVPGVGEAMAGYDAVRNFADMGSDLKRGKYLSALGNLGSGALNTVFAIPGVGTVGRWVKGAGKGLFRLFGGGAKAAKGVANGAKAVGRASKAMQGVGAGVHRFGMNMQRYGNRLRQSVPRPNFWQMMGGGLAAGAATSMGDARYEAKLQAKSDQADQAAQDYWGLMENAPSYNGMHSFNTNSPYYNGMRRPLTMHRQPGYGSALFWNRQPSTAY